MSQINFEWARRLSRHAVFVCVLLGLAACESQSCSGPDSFVLEDVDMPRIGFVEVPDGPLEKSNEVEDSPDTPSSQAAEQDEGAEPEAEPESAANDSVAEQATPTLGVESKRRLRIRRSRSRAGTSDAKKDAPLPLDVQPSKSKSDSTSLGDDGFGILRASDDGRRRVEAAPEPRVPSDSKIDRASSTVEQEVTFGDAPPHIEKMDREADARRRARERRRRQRKREAELRRVRDEIIDEALSKPPPPASATSTFAMDVDTGSYTLTGRKVTRGQIPEPEEIRVEEFINFFDYDYPEAQGAFGLTVEGAPSPFRDDPDTYLVRFGVKARELDESERLPQHVTLVFDLSKSMAAADAMPIAKKSAFTLFDELDPEDKVSVIGYASEPRLIASEVPVAQRDKLVLALSRLQAGASSGLQDALELAYEHANTHSSAATNSRVMLFSDGSVTLDEVDGQRISRELDEYSASGVGLVVLGVGADIYNDALLEAIADNGDGRYHHVNAPPEAYRLFGEELDATLYTVAEDAKIQVIFESETVRSFRKIGYENRELPDEFFRRDDVDAGEVGAGESVTALYEVQVHPGATGELGELRVRFNEPNGAKGKELAAGFRTDDLAEAFSDASDDLRFAASLAGFAEILQRSALAYGLDLERIIAVAEHAAGEVDERKSAVYLMRRLLELAERR